MFEIQSTIWPSGSIPTWIELGTAKTGAQPPLRCRALRAQPPVQAAHPTANALTRIPVKTSRRARQSRRRGQVAGAPASCGQRRQPSPAGAFSRAPEPPRRRKCHNRLQASGMQARRIWNPEQYIIDRSMHLFSIGTSFELSGMLSFLKNFRPKNLGFFRNIILVFDS